MDRGNISQVIEGNCSQAGGFVRRHTPAPLKSEALSKTRKCEPTSNCGGFLHMGDDEALMSPPCDPSQASSSTVKDPDQSAKDDFCCIS